MPNRVVNIPFPLGGINRDLAYTVEPPNTTPDALNVRPYDPLATRLRGGTRPGLAPYITGAVWTDGTHQTLPVAPVVMMETVGYINSSTKEQLECLVWCEDQGFNMPVFFSTDGTVGTVAGTLGTSSITVYAAEQLQKLYINAGGTIQIFDPQTGTLAEMLATPYTTGTISVAAGVVTLTGGAFPSWAGSGFLTITSGPDNTLIYNVQSMISSTQLSLDDSSVNIASGTSFSLSQVAGSLPTGTVFIASYRDRLVLAGPDHSWYMSRQQNPYDWNYGADADDGGRAIAGTVSDAGQMGTPITALVPFNNEFLVVGGPNSLWRITGDPAWGGRQDCISRAVGIIGGRAWVHGPGGELYFLARSGVHMLYYLARRYEGPQGKDEAAWLEFLHAVFGGQRGTSQGFGSKPGVLKQRTLDSMKQGRLLREQFLQEAEQAKARGDAPAYEEAARKAAWLKPKSDNPMQTQLDAYDGATDYLRDLRIKNYVNEHGWTRRQTGLASQTPGFRVPAPNGVASPLFTIFGPPSIKVPEGVNVDMYSGLLDQLQKLGYDYERANALGRGAFERVLGRKVAQRNFTPVDVLSHALGHVVDAEYPDLRDTLLGDRRGQDEAQKLAAARLSGIDPQKVSQAFRDYLQTPNERMGVIMQAFLSAPEQMQQLAPTLHARLDDYLASDPDLESIRDIKPGVSLAQIDHEVRVPGKRILGYYAVPDALARAIESFGSESLYNKLNRNGVAGKALAAGMRGTMWATQKGMQALLCIPGFHITTTSLLSGCRDLANSISALSGGEMQTALQSLGRLGTEPAQLLRRQIGGEQWRRLRSADPGTLTPEQQQQVEQSEMGGALLPERPLTQHGRRLVENVQSLRNPDNAAGDYISAGAKAVWNGLLAAPEKAAEISTRWAGNLKVGLALDMQADWEREHPGATDDQRRLGYQEIRQNLDAAFGQYNWKNMIVDRWLKDVAQLSTFAPAWSGGNAAMLTMPIRDTLFRAGRDGNPLVTKSMAMVPATLAVYAAMAALYQGLSSYCRTGQWQSPEDWKDLMFPRTGRKNADGSAERISLPGPIKDWMIATLFEPRKGIYGAEKPLEAVGHKLGLGPSTLIDLARNRDRYGHEISSPLEGESSAAASGRWVKDAAKYIGRKVGLPIPVQNATQRGGGAAEWAESVAGLAPAPLAQQRSPALADAIERLQQRQEGGAVTQEMAAQGAARKAAVEALRQGQTPHDLALGEQFGGRQIGQLRKEAAGTVYQHLFAKMPFADQVRNYRDLADDNEKAQVASLLAAAIRRAQAAAERRSATAVDVSAFQKKLALYAGVRDDVARRLAK